MSAFDCAFDLGHDGLDRAKKWNYGKWNETVADLPECAKSVVIRSDASDLELRIAIKESSARAVREKHIRVHAVSIQGVESLCRVVDFERNLLPALRIIAFLVHRRWTVADVSALNLTVHHPAFHRKVESVFTHFVSPQAVLFPAAPKGTCLL